MIAIIALIIITIWLAIVIFLCRRIPVWLGVKRNTKLISFLLFPVLFVLPIADDLIGRWQFYRLCEREAVVTLSPGWEAVKGARRVSLPRTEVAGILIPTYSQGSEYLDVETGKTFMKHPHFYTYGGMLLGRLGLGLGVSTSCLPKNAQEVEKMIDFYELLKQGDMK